jgi:hypothetical protein
VIIPSGQTLDVTNATLEKVASSGESLQVKYSNRIGAVAMTNTSFTEISTSLRVTIIIKSATSLLEFMCPLYTEVDSATSHGLTELVYSTDGGSVWNRWSDYNITAATDNDIGFGFIDYMDHSFAVGTSVIFRVNYRLTSSGGNHTIADTGPGESPRAYLKVQEIAE